MRFVRQYLVPRLMQYAFVIWLGITMVFFLPRLLPSDPVEMILAQMKSQAIIDPVALEEMAVVFREMFGLEAGLFSQYVSFWQRLFTGDFGPSLFTFPTPVITLIMRSLPWTVGLLLTSTVLGWIIGNILGGLTGYFRERKILKIFDGIAMFLRPMPYYILALLLMILFAYLLPVFPSGRGYTPGIEISFTWPFITSVLKHGFLPAMSLILLTTAINHQTMRLLVQSVKGEGYVKYAKIGNVKERTIFARYIMRNAMLPQVTALTLTFGQILGGALITEIVFAYPGLGYLLYRAIIVGDYNLLMGITTISILVITTCILIIDLLYPLIDPRIRFK